MYIDKEVKIRGLSLGVGKPKICIPIVGRTREEIIALACNVMEKHGGNADMAEIRIDYFNEAGSKAAVTELLFKLREVLKDMPMLFTLRSKREGGEMEVGRGEYEAIIKAAIDSGCIDAADVELFIGESCFRSIVSYACKKKVKIIGSSHDFKATPDSVELKGRLERMERLGADVAKIAVMPEDRKDVLRLMSVLAEADDSLKIPVIGISMGGMGAVSRVAGELFGSCLTFGVADKASAPGQMEAAGLKEALELLHYKSAEL